MSMSFKSIYRKTTSTHNWLSVKIVLCFQNRTFAVKWTKSFI